MDRIDCSIAAAAEFLASHRSRDGLWRDFHTLAGAGADWVTAFVSYAASGCDELNAEVDAAVTALVQRQRSNGGWGYNHFAPTDCDSTSWVLLAMTGRSRARSADIELARRYVLDHQTLPSGGFATYNAADGIDRFIDAPDVKTVAGWLAPHPCVTSVAAQALLRTGESRASRVVASARDYLLAARDDSGGWTSYWWPGHSYNTFFALQALLMAEATDAAQPHALERSSGDGRRRGVFETALRVLTLLLVPDDQAQRAAGTEVAWLLGCQRADGGWDSRPMLRIPPPTQEDVRALGAWSTDARRGSGVVIADPRRIFTSAAALWALTQFRALRS